jgi:hypothetical protein
LAAVQYFWFRSQSRKNLPDTEEATPHTV